MQDEDKDRFIKMAKTYDKMARYLVPQYNFLQNEALNLAGIERMIAPIVVDLGAGSGIFLEKILRSNPHAFCYWVDSSEEFERVARKRLSRFGERVRYILSPLEDDWESQVDEPPDVILSMSAIHHLESHEKRALYQRCHDHLKRGGWFVNIDEMKTVDPAAYRNSLLFWVQYVEKAQHGVPDSLRDSCRKMMAQFDRWKQRNIDRIDAPKNKGEDIHEGFAEQVCWLKEIGFVGADVFIKYYLWCMIGGQKTYRIRKKLKVPKNLLKKT